MAKIYLSSTYTDLVDFREIVYHSLRQMHEDAIAMEDYVATDQRPLDKCLADVAECEAYVGLFAWRYGYIPEKDNPQQKSITEREYREAVARGKPRFIFLLNKNTAWPPQKMDSSTGEGEGRQRIQAFRDELTRDETVSFFSTPDELARLVSIAISNWRAKKSQQEKTQQAEEQARRVSAMIIDQRELLDDRLKYFVGREKEIADLRSRIEAQQNSGGYVIVTGDAGQGKSSLIAKLIKDQGERPGAFHFIRVDPGPGYQTNILRTILGQLILKYDLPAWYANESYPVLRDSLRTALAEIALQRKQEVICLDGLDLLEVDASGAPDLSFLPDQPPDGIVFVVGTRPNKTLDRLKMLVKSYEPYELRALSREDFALMLQRRPVSLPDELGNRLYGAMQGNALYLNLVAQVLSKYSDLQPEDVIARVENNPNNIFSLAFERMKQPRPEEWNEVIRPILGALLVAQEPLAPRQIAHIFSGANNRFREGIKSLGGFLTHVGQEKYTLFHLKLYEYLKQNMHEPERTFEFDNEEEADLHGRLADWCGQGEMEALWSETANDSPRNDYRDYARRHYITHLYRAGMYARLFEVLDDGEYERGKLRVDLSGRSSVSDLTLGCQAAAREAMTLEEGRERLIHLWCYALLRSSLASQADAYPIEAFDALLMLGKVREGLDLAELLTQPAHKLAALVLFAKALARVPAQAAEGQQLFNRAYELAFSIEDRHTQARALRAVVKGYIGAGQLEQATEVTRSIPNDYEQAEALVEVSDAYAFEADYDGANAVARSMLLPDEYVKALSTLAATLDLAGQRARAKLLWQEVSATAITIADNDQRVRALYHLLTALFPVSRWEQAETTVQAIESNYVKVKALSELACALTLAGESERAEAHWAQVRALSSPMTEEQMRALDGPVTGAYERACMQRVLATALARAKHWEQAKEVTREITDVTQQVLAWGSIAASFIEEHQWEEARAVVDHMERVYRRDEVVGEMLDELLVELCTAFAGQEDWEQAQSVANTIAGKEARFRAKMNIVGEMACAGQREWALRAWNEARVTNALQESAGQSGAVGVLVAALAGAGEYEQAQAIASASPDGTMRAAITSKLAIALARAGQIARAKALIDTLSPARARAAAQQAIVTALLQAGELEQAQTAALTIAREEERWQALRQVVAAYTAGKQWEQAQNAARQVSDAGAQATALSGVAVALAQNDELEQARRIVNSLAVPYAKEQAWCDLATALERRGFSKFAEDLRRRIRNTYIRKKADCNKFLIVQQRRLAESTAREINEQNVRDEALFNVALAYIEARDWERALGVATDIWNRERRYEASSALAISAARAGQWERAFAAYAVLRRDMERIAVAQTWGEILAQSGARDQYEKVVAGLKGSRERISLQAGVANNKVQNGRDLEAIRFVQQAWLQAETKEICLSLLPLAQSLIERYPEMGLALYETFAWVDGFLKEKDNFLFV